MKREPESKRLDPLLDARVDPLDDAIFQAELERDEELLSAFVAWRSIERQLQGSATSHTPHVRTMSGTRIAILCAAAMSVLAAGTWFALRERTTPTAAEPRSEDRAWRPLPASDAIAVLHFEASIEIKSDRRQTIWQQHGLGLHASSRTQHFVDASRPLQLTHFDAPTRTK